MDPLAALGLASNIVQFVDYTSKLLSGTRELYISSTGAKAENLELESIVRNIQQLAESVKRGNIEQRDTLENQNEPLLDLSNQCVEVSNELLSILEGLKVKGPHRSWESFHQALKSQWKKSEIESLERRLDRISNNLNARALLDRQAIVLSKIQELAAGNRRLEVNRTQEILELQESFRIIFEQIQRESQKNTTSRAPLRRLTLAAEKGLGYSEEQSFLNSIRFDAIEDRQIAVHPAHRETFSWIFRKSGSTDEFQNSANFADWLGSDHTLFWVSGKPGSGKSTLMKFICEHQTTQKTLKTWADKQQLVLASFFFWSAGRQALQRSQEGLLRSILYQILRQCPDLIPEAAASLLWKNPSDAFGGFTTSKLLNVFRHLATRLNTSKVKFCFFIDGLDEYEGKPNDIIRLVELLKSGLQVKICVSSRPWNEFEKAFGQEKSKKLYMQELTRGDIELYVRDTLEKDPGFEELKQRDSRCPDLVKDVVDAAEGVFLWVFLVVRSLLEGLTNADRIVDLQRRLRDLPTDLNNYFERILFTVENFYRKESAQMFQVTLTAYDNLPLMTYWFIDQDDPTLLENMVVEPLAYEIINNRLDQMKKRLNACCKGLLEAQFSSRPGVLPAPEEKLFYLRVDFIHRTVRDFLRIPEMLNMINKWIGTTFDKNIAICEAIVCQIKSTPLRETHFKDGGSVSTLLRIFFYHIKILDDGQCPLAIEARLLDELEKTLQNLESHVPEATSVLSSFQRRGRKVEAPPLSVLEEAVYIGLEHYVSIKLDQSLLDPETQSTLLLTALLPSDQSNPDSRLKIVSFLLKQGFNPNSIVPGDTRLETPWMIYLRYECSVLQRDRDVNIDTRNSIIKEMLKYGADPDLSLPDDYGGQNIANLTKVLIPGVDQESHTKDSRRKRFLKVIFPKKYGK